MIFTGLLATFFQLLYHQLAWAYDFVAWCVSLGAWNKWVRSMTHHISGSKILELGFGPGHLQIALMRAGYFTCGIDESSHMARIARRRLNRLALSQSAIVRGRGESIPFVSGHFDTVISTFPPPYIFKVETIAEIRRILKHNGQMTILLAADLPGRNILVRSLRWIMRITGQIPPPGFNLDHITQPFEQQGFKVDAAWMSQREGNLLILTGWKIDQKQ